MAKFFKVCFALLWMGLPCVLAAAPLKTVATTGMVADLVKQVGGDRVDVTTLMGPGVDPHLYKATASDIAALQRAAVVFYNGLHLEGKLGSVLERLGKSGRPVAAITDGLTREKLLKPEEFEGEYDPHIWFDVALWAECVEKVREVLTTADPAGADTFKTNAAATKARLLKLHEWVKTRAAELPEAQRVLVTSHDAYNYFGRAYGFKVVGLQGISTVTEAGLADFTKLVDYIKSNGIKAIFVESSVPHQAIERIAADSGAKVGGELFSDAMGAAGDMENGYDKGTYDGMVRHNVNTIVDALK